MINLTSVRFEVFGRYHDDEANGVLVLEHLVRPASDGAHALDCGDTIVGDENLATIDGTR